MKVPISWLKDYVDVVLPPAELAQKLTLAGFEVAGIVTTGGNLENVVVGQITAINPHPNADRLRLATVDLGGVQETVVCGAPNLKIGDKIAFARLGAQLMDTHTGKVEALKPAKIRGVESKGMICSEKELGISENHEGILVLSPDTVVGRPLSDFIGDTVLDIDITANRPDCLSILGIAHEVAALTGQKMHIPEVSYPETGSPLDQQIAISIGDPELCPRYTASLITGVKIKESPAWMQERLKACGARPINNIVDITNYVMLEYGQPLHSFDYDRLKNRQIKVRRAKDGEKFFTLDTNERQLTGEMLTIADGERTVAIGGVMGGLNSQVMESTTSILLEAASFKAANIHYTSRSLGLLSEASTRFERNISAGVTIPALRHATQLVMEMGGGTVARGIIDVYPGKKEPAALVLTPAEVKRIVGVEYSTEQIKTTLESLGFECEVRGSDISVTAPYWRSDIRWDVDLIEEVARINGYDKIPTTLLAEAIPRQNPEPILSLRKQIKQNLAGAGFQEILTYTLNGLDMLNKLSPEGKTTEKPIHIANPMTAEQEYLRPTLRANALAALNANRRFEEGGIRFFELGRIYLARENDLPQEPEMLCGVMNGARVEKGWLGGEGALDFYDAKGTIEGLFNALGTAVSFEKSEDAGLHPARQAAIIAGDRKIKLGVIGELHPRVAATFEIEGATALFEVNVTALLALAAGGKMFQTLPKFPSIVRDIALVVDTGITHKQITDIVKGFSLISEVKLFDVYSGKQVAEGKKSLAYRLVYQSPAYTLKDDEVNRVQDALLKKLAKDLGATLRS
ncbi:MAG TPA: phenylalanine--tRNA ligase subunit beta [Dehalococcoidales bacterium]|nr:phenylalanine--tRNA ligase subunit beta [Dehalococcoidales bacterium]